MKTFEIEVDVRSPAVQAGARSHVYGRLAEILAFPTAKLADALASGEWLAEVAAMASHLPFDWPLADGDGVLNGGSITQERMEAEYIRLFEVGAGRPFCPLYEGSHRSGRMKIMEELVRFYEHFGLLAAAGDQPDHVCAELEFMHYLAFKQAAAISAGADAGGLMLAQKEFIERRLCRWLPQVAALVASAEAARFYRPATALASEFCRLDLGWLKAMSGKSVL